MQASEAATDEIQMPSNQINAMECSCHAFLDLLSEGGSVQPISKEDFPISRLLPKWDKARDGPMGPDVKPCSREDISGLDCNCTIGDRMKRWIMTERM